jgi:hypothetical protein
VVYTDAAGLNPRTLGSVLTAKAVAGLKDGFVTATALLPVGLLPGGSRARVRLHPYTVLPVYRARTSASGDVVAQNTLLVKSVGLQVRPQGAKWKGETAFVATGTGGSVRPSSPLDVFHVDAPDGAGLFEGTALAFRRTLTRGPLAPTTQWARADDLLPSPLLAANVLDVLALRANPSQLLTGTVRCYGLPPEPLDTLDAPYDAGGGRRWLVGSRAWHVRPARVDITVIEIGPGESLAPTLLPDGLRIIDGLTQNQPRYRATDQGLRLALL